MPPSSNCRWCCCKLLDCAVQNPLEPRAVIFGPSFVSTSKTSFVSACCRRILLVCGQFCIILWLMKYAMTSGVTLVHSGCCVAWLMACCVLGDVMCTGEARCKLVWKALQASKPLGKLQPQAPVPPYCTGTVVLMISDIRHVLWVVTACHCNVTAITACDWPCCSRALLECLAGRARPMQEVSFRFLLVIEMGTHNFLLVMQCGNALMHASHPT